MADFIPKQYKKETVSIRISTEKVQLIDKLAANYGLSRNALIIQCIDFALKNLPDTSFHHGEGEQE